MASPNTLRLRRETGRREGDRLEKNIRVVERSIREFLWVERVEKSPEHIAHKKACQEEMERVVGEQK
jgi:TolB-like protein